ncbi:Uma2 family endonuclease [Flexivirga caeni]|uniref:Uma2 family endonuclease n=1 Tax=Flexivirga caeni TaxID=2294115 RepID=A0A3M9LYL9_9MICO|nr:Uma2 family endonuclease [Flexivirga caeni]RNI18381.1 Uma2 family endonuclease [Flexivirga caeni]
MSELAMHDHETIRLPMSWDTYDSLEYDDGIRGAEYLDGQLVMTPGFPDWGHQKTILYLWGVLQATVDANAGEDVIVEFAWKPPGIQEEYGPDVMVCTVPDDPRRFTGVPLLCVEVTSGNRDNDLVRKRAKYAAGGLPDYWIVDRADRALRCHRLRSGVLVEDRTLWADEHDRPVRVSYADREVTLDMARLFGAVSP